MFPVSPALAGKFFTTTATWEAQHHFSDSIDIFSGSDTLSIYFRELFCLFVFNLIDTKADNPDKCEIDRRLRKVYRRVTKPNELLLLRDFCKVDDS